MKLVSIIMPSYNSSLTILHAIESILAQSYKKWELLVVDDCSTDNTLEIIRSITDPRINCYRLSTNSGSPAKPRNFALELACGDYIAFLDSDDCWEGDKLDKQIAFMDKNHVMFTCTAYNIVDVNGKLISSYCPPDKVSYDQLLSNNSIGCLTAVVRADLMGDFKFPVCGHEDFALWLKLIKKSKHVYGLNEKLAYYRKLGNSVSSDKGKLIAFYWNIYRREENFGVLKSLFLCFKYFVNVVWFKYK
jgi:teichuronic acid biosynthesis glycosyltransferase TuaG